MGNGDADARKERCKERKGVGDVGFQLRETGEEEERLDGGGGK